MNEQFTGLDEAKEESLMEKTFSTDNIQTTNVSNQSPAPIKKSKKKLILCIVVIVAVVAGVITLIILHQSEFEKVKSKCISIAGCVSGSGDYFTLDTDPDDWANMDSSVRALLIANQQEKELEAIKYANEALGFNGSLYNKMIETTAMMGRQTDENKKYKVSWTYHPDDGLEVTYEKK